MAEKFVPYEKMSKKEKRKIDKQQRNDWGGCNPVTKQEPDEKGYRRHEKHRKKELPEE